MDPQTLFARYQDLQRYVGWEPADESRVRAAAPVLCPCFPDVIDDFYAEIERHPEARQVVTGGSAQIERLKGSLRAWLEELFFGKYDADYVMRRWKAGLRHVQVGLNQVYVNVAVSRLRSGLLAFHEQTGKGTTAELLLTRRSINKLIDLDLAIIEDAYQTEFLDRQRRIERLATLGEVTGGMLDIVPTFVLLLDSDGKILRFNSYLEELTGHRLDDVQGRDYFDVFLPERERQRMRGVFQTLLRDNHVTGVTNAIVGQGGQEVEIRWSAKVLRDGDHAVLGVLASGQDISELRQAQDRALQAERLAAIGQTMTGLVHESRNALQRSRACLEMLSVEVADRPTALTLVERTQRAQNDLHQLFEEVREYAAPIDLTRKKCCLAEIWRKAWHDVADSQSEKEVRLVETIANVDLKCEVDPFTLGQVFRNILENAIQASPKNAEIVIAGTEARCGGRPEVPIAVRDFGPGIPKHLRSRVFEPFFTTKAKGTGLGLAIARRIIQCHEGEIAVEEHDGPGATILIHLPRASR